jgi:hypothetical protein
VNSPYFNVHQDTIRFFNILQELHPDFPEKKSSKSVICKKLFPEEEPDEKKLYPLIKNLQKLFYSFMLNEAHRETESEMPPLLLRTLQQKGMDQYLPRLLSREIENLETQPFRESAFFLRRYELEQIAFDFSMDHENRSLKVGIQEMVDDLDTWYLIQKLKFASSMADRAENLDVSYQYPMLEEIMGFLERNFGKRQRITDIYYLVYRMVSAPEGEPYYRKLSELVPEYSSRIPEEELLNIYLFLLNFCNRMYKKGDEPFLREMWNIYQQMIRFNLLPEGSRASTLLYKNIVSLGLKLEELDWTENFIRNYKDHVEESTREGVYHLNLANIYFAKRDFSKCKTHLKEVEFVDPFFRMGYHSLLLKTYYECGDIEPLLSLCHTLKGYIRRNKSLSERNQELFLNFVSFTGQLARTRFDLHRSGHPEKIEQEIRNADLLVEREWLREKARQLIQG